MFYLFIFFQPYQEAFITTFFDDLGKVSRKRIAVLLDFVQMMEREGPAQIFFPLFTNCIYWVNLGMGREGETLAQIFWHIGVQESGTSCPN